MKKICLIISTILIVSCWYLNAEEAADNTASQPEIKGPQATELSVRSAEITSVKGMAAIMKKETGEWKKLADETELNEGDQVSVGPESEVVITVDENTITLSEGTLFRFRLISDDTKIDFWHGRMKARIRKLSMNHSFEVISPVAVSTVKGTEFDMEVTGDNTAKIRTYSGKVSVKDLATGKEVMVKPGYECTVGPGMSEPLLEPIEKPAETAPAQEEEMEEPETEKTGPEKEVEDEPKAKSPKKGPAAGLGINGSFGADVLTDPDNPGESKIYYSLSLMPELSIWRFGVGFDLNIYFDEEGNIRSEDWDSLDDVVGKIWYIRYGKRNDPLYILFGGIKSYSLGHGFIMSNYTNMLNYPDVRNKGVILEINRGKLGIQSVISNIDSYPVIGGRLSYMPLLSSGLPVIGRLKLGVSGAMDKNPDMDNSTEDDEVLFYGADCEMPLLNIFPVDSYIYADYATCSLGDMYGIDDCGMGTALGLGGTVLKKILFGLEYRKLDNNFIPSYFDTYYEAERADKIDPAFITPGKEPRREGPFFMLGFDLMNKLGVKLTFEDYNIDPADRYPYFHGEVSIDPVLLMNKFTLAVSYDNKNVNKLSDIAELDGAILTTELGYMIAPNILLLVTQKQTFDETGNAAKTMSMRTRFRF
ncbi:MAG: FecR family protein [Elusimicrobiota bacterium]